VSSVDATAGRTSITVPTGNQAIGVSASSGAVKLFNPSVYLPNVQSGVGTFRATGVAGWDTLSSGGSPVAYIGYIPIPSYTATIGSLPITASSSCHVTMATALGNGAIVPASVVDQAAYWILSSGVISGASVGAPFAGQYVAYVVCAYPGATPPPLSLFFNVYLPQP